MTTQQKDSQLKNFQSMNQWYTYMKDILKNTELKNEHIKLTLFIDDYDEELQGKYGKSQYVFPVKAIYVCKGNTHLKTYLNVDKWPKNHVLLYKSEVDSMKMKPKNISIYPDFNVLFNNLENHKYTLNEGITTHSLH
jgi:hypothetical protein